MLSKPFALAALLAASCGAQAAASDADLAAIRAQIDEIKKTYEQRIAALESRLAAAEARPVALNPLPAAVEQPASSAPIASAQTAANSFNPAISLILSGTYGNFSRDPDNYRLSGFIPGGELGPGARGFGLGESELGIYANIDPRFYGGLNVALHPDDTVSVEEAFVQTTALPYGLTVKAGRYFSGIGYLNAQHAHTWDFVDAPLAYQAFLGGQYGDDGVQVKWLAPTDLFLEFGAEVGRGRNFPAADSNRNGAGAAAVYAHVGGDIGVSSNWRAGLSVLRTTPKDRQYDDLDNGGVSNAFSGTSRLMLADFVWKWAPNGNATRTNVKVQGEYFRREEDGSVAFDVNGVNNVGRYNASQSGWYLQSVYQFMPYWRVGARLDRLDSGNTDFGANAGNLAATDYSPSRLSLMLDWTPSEYSRWRLQIARDKARRDEPDTQLMLQYQMSLGAHGAHSY